MYRARDNIDSDFVFNTDENNNVFKTKIKVRPSFTNIEDIESKEEIDYEKLNSERETIDLTCTNDESESKNESLAMCSGKQVSAPKIPTNESEFKKALNSKLIEETALMSGVTNKINCILIGALSSNLNKEPTLNSSLSSTTNELNENRVLSNNKGTASESFACNSGTQVSAPIITSNESEPKKTLSSNLIAHTTKILLEQKKNINSQQQDLDKSNLNAMLDKKTNKR
jgi:hypothetical protein